MSQPFSGKYSKNECVGVRQINSRPGEHSLREIPTQRALGGFGRNLVARKHNGGQCHHSDRRGPGKDSERTLHSCKNLTVRTVAGRLQKYGD